MIRIISVGKKHESWVVPGLERYQKRLIQPYDAKWEFIPHSPSEDAKARESESEAILLRLVSTDYVILLDETGKQLDSPALSHLLEKRFVNSENTVIIIGGAYGVDARIIHRANYVWSLSDLVFPHQLVRLILIEQIYRAQEIAKGGKYHHY